MKKVLLLAVALILCNFYAFSQNFEWGVKSNSNPKFRYADINKNGSCYFSGIVQYGLVIDTASFTGGNNYDAYVGMVNSGGHIQFLKKAVYDVAFNDEVINNIAADNNDNFFLTFNKPYNPVPIYVGEDTIQKDTTTSRILLAKYNSSGNLLWSKQYKPVNPSANPSHEFVDYSDEKTPIVVDESGCVYIYVTLSGYVDVRIDTAVINWSGNHLFKFSPNGDMIYHKKIDKLNVMAFNCDHQKNLLVAGSVTGVANSAYNTLDFGNNVTLSFPSLQTNQFEFVLVKYDSAGVAQWAKITTSKYPTAAVNNVTPIIKYLSIDKYNASYLTGYYNTQIVFFTDTLKGVSTAYERNNFMVKFKAGGDYHWAKSFVDTSTNQRGAEIRQVKFDSGNNMYLFSEYIQKGFNFYGNNMPKVSVSGSSDRLLAKLDTNFTLKWWKYFVAGENNNVLTKINLSSDDDLYVVGGGTSATKIATLVSQSGYWMPVEDSATIGTINGTPYICKFGKGSSSGLNNQAAGKMAQRLYPNPADNKIFFTNADEKVLSLEIINCEGRVVFKADRLDLNAGIDVSQFKPGIYIVRMHAENEVGMFKFIKH